MPKSIQMKMVNTANQPSYVWPALNMKATYLGKTTGGFVVGAYRPYKSSTSTYRVALGRCWIEISRTRS